MTSEDKPRSAANSIHHHRDSELIVCGRACNHQTSEFGWYRIVRESYRHGDLRFGCNIYIWGWQYLRGPRSDTEVDDVRSVRTYLIAFQWLELNLVIVIERCCVLLGSLEPGIPHHGPCLADLVLPFAEISDRSGHLGRFEGLSICQIVPECPSGDPFQE